jgi:hypothetical protein
MWFFWASKAEKKLKLIESACNCYRNEFFASPVHAGRLTLAALEIIRVAYEQTLNQPYPGLKSLRLIEREDS